MAGLTDGLLPYRAPAMDNPFVTPGDQQRERISAAFGWDVGSPWQEFSNRASTPLTLLASFLGRSPVGARIGNDVAWAAQTPSAITGGRPSYHLHGLTDAHVPNIGLAGRPVSHSSAGLLSQNPAAFDRRGIGHPRNITDEITFYGPRGPANDWRTNPGGQN